MEPDQAEMTFDIETLRSLLARCEKATGSDSDLDPDIWAICTKQEVKLSSIPPYHWIYSWDGMGWDIVPRLTRSIDAALALVEKVLGKHWRWELKRGIEYRCVLWYLEHDWNDEGAPTGYHAYSAPLAIICALLRALIAQTEEARQDFQGIGR